MKTVRQTKRIGIRGEAVLTEEPVKDEIPDIDGNYGFLKDDFALANALNLSVKDFETDCEDISDILKLLNRGTYHATKSKRILMHQAFVGVPDLGSPVLAELHDEFNIQNFEQLTRAIAMAHSQKLYGANEDWFVNPLNPSLNDCVCFVEELTRLDKTDSRTLGFTNDAGNFFSKERILQHAKMIISIAKKYLQQPSLYYKAYLHIHEAALSKVGLDKCVIDELTETKDIELETILLLLIDIEERGLDLSNITGGMFNGFTNVLLRKG